MYIFARAGKLKEADTLETILNNTPNHEQSYNYYFAKGAVNEARGNLDSAIVCYIHDLECSSLQEKQPSLSHLFSIYRKQGDYERATEYAQQYQDNALAINKAKQQEWIRNAKGMYDYQRDKEREETLARENDAMKFWGAVSIGILFTTIVSLIAFYFYRKKKLMEEAIGKDKKLNELNAQLHAKGEEIARAESSLRQQEQRAAELETEIKAKQAGIDKLVRMSALSGNRISRPGLLAALEKTARGGKSMSEEEWLRLSSTIDMEDPGFRALLLEHFPRANEATVRTGYLLRMGMSNQQIEVLTGSPHQSAWNRIRKVKTELGMQ